MQLRITNTESQTIPIAPSFSRVGGNNTITPHDWESCHMNFNFILGPSVSLHFEWKPWENITTSHEKSMELYQNLYQKLTRGIRSRERNNGLDRRDELYREEYYHYDNIIIRTTSGIWRSAHQAFLEVILRLFPIHYKVAKDCTSYIITHRGISGPRVLWPTSNGMC